MTENYKSSEIGHEITCTFKIEDRNLLNNQEGKLRELLRRALLKDNFNILNLAEYHFSPEGYSCIFLLGESHADVHTYPEHGSLVFNMYSCRGENDAKNTFEYLKKELNNPKIIFYKEDKVPVTEKAAKKLSSN
ncbi:MAG: S-adenosylmethionine decarboxylase [Candidatus Nanoarchaeia archaeon]|nr:S-adenosylmethionine decarboxylase [Candidatus Nanoarchaeia archaeon]MDD5357610.1 S-adenosylmethionine decarboxylase [Candidatus Nanoarchaeia archaeon]MDD5588529.1 S-adenosylmethionine decarboxylase [Candidatus Nanoarchaeia archaeon]